MAGVPQMWGITQVTLGFCGSLFSHSDTVFCKAFDRLPGTYEIYTDTSSTEKDPVWQTIIHTDEISDQNRKDLGNE